MAAASESERGGRQKRCSFSVIGLSPCVASSGWPCSSWCPAAFVICFGKLPEGGAVNRGRSSGVFTFKTVRVVLRADGCRTHPCPCFQVKKHLQDLSGRVSRARHNEL